MISEAQFAQSGPDFINKLSIAAKEANETAYWLNLLKDTSFLNEETHQHLKQDLQEIQRMLTASIKTAKANLR